MNKLSASRIKVAQTCSWQYWTRYILKLPDKSNDGAKRGTICHLVFECLGNPRHKKQDKQQEENNLVNLNTIPVEEEDKINIDDVINADMMSNVNSILSLCKNS